MSRIKAWLPDDVKRLAWHCQSYAICAASQFLEPLIRGNAMADSLPYHQNLRGKILSKWGQRDAEDRDRRYEMSLRYLQSGMRVLDCGAGTGRLQDVLSERVEGVRYRGLESDQNYVDLALGIGRSVEHFDINDLDRYAALLEDYQPDVVYAMYFFYFLREPIKYLQVTLDRAPLIILSGANHGRWPQRLRFLLGRAPITGDPLYESYLVFRGRHGNPVRDFTQAVREWPRDVNSAYPRIWTYQDYIDVFNDLGTHWSHLCSRRIRRGNHGRVAFSSLRARGFQFALTKQEGIL